MKIGFLRELELIHEIAKQKSLSFRRGDIVARHEQRIRAVPLVLKGCVKVLRVDENGNKFFLYYLKSGQFCAVSLSACLTGKPNKVTAIAEEDTELITVSSESVSNWFNQYPSWREFVLSTLNDRFDELIRTIDSMAFSKTDERLVKLLSAKSEALSTTSINVTHQQLADELATSREVISRLLKQLEQRGAVRLSRNRIELLVGAKDS